MTAEATDRLRSISLSRGAELGASTLRPFLQFCPPFSRVTGSSARWYFTDGPKTASTCSTSLLMRFSEAKWS